jgi:hypothetical protein
VETSELLKEIGHGLKQKKPTSEITAPLLQKGYTLTEIDDGLRQLGRDPLLADRRARNWKQAGLYIITPIVLLVTGVILFLSSPHPETQNVINTGPSPTAGQFIKPAQCGTVNIDVNSGGSYTTTGKALSCFADKAVNCSPALMDIVRRFADPSTDETVSVNMKPGDDGKCVLNFTTGGSHAKKGICRFDKPTHITVLFKRWENGKADLRSNLQSEFSEASCIGDYFSR